MKASAVLVVLLLCPLRPMHAGRPVHSAWALIGARPNRNTFSRARATHALHRRSSCNPRSSAARAVGSWSPTLKPDRRKRFLVRLPKAAHDQTGEPSERLLFVFGVGYVATAIALTFLRKGWAVHGTCTDPRKVKSLGDQGVQAYIFDDWSGPMMQPEPLDALARATCVLSTVPPALQSGTDPVLVAHEAELRWAHQNGSLRWVGYLSSTGVYGDRGGGWVTEADEPWPIVPRTKARLKAERSWLRLHARDGIPAHVFRLAGIYGPGRSALDSVARHNGDIRLAGSDDGTMISRIHVADIVGVVEASVEGPDPGMVVNVADDLPSTRYETLAYGCRLLGYPRQDPDPSEKYNNRRGGGHKRVDNDKMRRLLAASGRSLIFPDYRVGLKALHAGDGRPFSEPAEIRVAPAEPPQPSTIPVATSVINGATNFEDLSSLAADVKALSLQVQSLEETVRQALITLSVRGDEGATRAEEAEESRAPDGERDQDGSTSGPVASFTTGEQGVSNATGGAEDDSARDVPATLGVVGSSSSES